MTNHVVLLTDDQTLEAVQRLPRVFRRLASTGVFFMNNYVSTPLCQPMRATLMTGQLPRNHKQINNDVTTYGLLNHNNMLARRFQVAGGNTAFFGKFINPQTAAMPQPVGWNEWHCCSPQTMYNYDINDNGVVTSKGAAVTDYNTTIITDKAVTFILAQNGVSAPFLVFIGFKPPHFDSTIYNTVPHPNYLNCVPSTKKFPRTPNWNPISLAGKPSYIRALPMLSSTTINSIDTAWRRETESLYSLDYAVGQIIDAIATAGKTSSTVIWLTSDNGYCHGEFRIESQKYVPYDFSTKVPLIVSGPASLVAQNKFCHHISTSMDIPVTIYAMSGMTATVDLDGKSLASTLLNPLGVPYRNSVLLEWLGVNAPAPVAVPRYYGIRTQDYKYIEYIDTGERELYNMRNDPWEITNLANRSDYTTAQNELQGLLDQTQNCVGSACVV